MYALFRKSRGWTVNIVVFGVAGDYGGGYFYGLNTKCVCRNWTRAIYCWFARDVTAAMLVKGKEKLVHLKRVDQFFEIETFPVGPNRSIEFWNSGNLKYLRAALYMSRLQTFCNK